MNSDKILSLVIFVLELIVLGASRQSAIDKLSIQHGVSAGFLGMHVPKE